MAAQLAEEAEVLLGPPEGCKRAYHLLAFPPLGACLVELAGCLVKPWGVALAEPSDSSMAPTAQAFPEERVDFLPEGRVDFLLAFAWPARAELEDDLLAALK